MATWRFDAIKNSLALIGFETSVKTSSSYSKCHKCLPPDFSYSLNLFLKRRTALSAENYWHAVYNCLFIRVWKYWGEAYTIKRESDKSRIFFGTRALTPNFAMDRCFWRFALPIVPVIGGRLVNIPRPCCVVSLVFTFKILSLFPLVQPGHSYLLASKFMPSILTHSRTLTVRPHCALFTLSRPLVSLVLSLSLVPANSLC